MIPRYTREQMGTVWRDDNKFAKWLEVELAATLIYWGSDYSYRQVRDVVTGLSEARVSHGDTFRLPDNESEHP